MKNCKFLLVTFFIISFYGLQAQKGITKIAFGSCGHENTPLPIFYEIVKHKPDLFVFLGDNIYGDTKVLDTLKIKYGRLAAKPSFQALKKNVPIIATWDDHDYGWNDIGRHYELKTQSKQVFLDFFDEAVNSERRKRDGIYTSYYYKKPTPFGEKTIQVILLDTRTFRDDLKLWDSSYKKPYKYFYDLDYVPYTNSDSTMLGATQWQWLETELHKPADLRIIGSSTQFGIEYNGYEAWANFPAEQQKMLDLIKKTKANGVLFISGDVHYAEISKLQDSTQTLYPIYDVTSSGLSSTWLFATPNKNRIEGPIMDNHFGMLTINWNKKDPTVTMEVWDIRNNQRIEYTIPLSEIYFKSKK